MRKTLIRFFTIADFEEEEKWLSKKHSEGWKIVKMTPPCFYTFEQCEPDDYIYKLDFQNSEQTPEYMQMLSDFGWEYFASCLGWLYFRKKASGIQTEEDGELFSDSESKTEFVTKIVKTRMLPLTLIFFCCILPNLSRYLGGTVPGPAGRVFTIFFAVMFLIYVFLIVYCGIKLRKIKNKYSK